MSVKVHNKQGKVICEITIDKEFKPPWDIEEWAWNTAQHIADERERRCGAMVEVMDEKAGNPSVVEKLKRRLFPWDRTIATFSASDIFEDYRCPTCLHAWVEPVAIVAGLLVFGFSPGYKYIGYACINPDCPVHDIIIPLILIDRIDEKP